MLAELLPTNGSNTDRIFMLPLLHGYRFLRNWIFAMLALENTVLLTSKNELLKKDDCFLSSVSLTWNMYLLVKSCSAYNSGASLQRNKHHCDNPPGIMQLPLIKQVSAVFQGDYHFLFCSERAQNKREAATIK